MEVTVGGFGERAGNAALEEIAFLLSAFGERDGLAHGVDLAQIGPTSRLFESLTGVRTHPNKAVIGQCALVPVRRRVLREPRWSRVCVTCSRRRQSAGPSDDSSTPAASRQPSGPYALEAYNVLSSSHAPPVGLVVIRRGGKTLTQTSHGTGPIDALFRAVDKALGFSTRMVLYSVSTLSTGTEAATEVIVTVELRGTDSTAGTAARTSSRRACAPTWGLQRHRGVGHPGGPPDFHVAGEYLWE